MLISKLEFLGISRQSISNFHMLLLQTEVPKVYLLFENYEIEGAKKLAVLQWDKNVDLAI